MASVIIKNAAMGQGKAMTALYQANKNTLYTIARSLLLEEGQAASAVYGSLRETWSTLKAARLSTPEQFTALATLKLVEQCKKQTLQKNPKALRVPHGRNVALPETLPIKDTFDSETDYILANLPVLHRYVLVLSSLAAMNTMQIANLLQLDLGLVEDMVAAQEDNLRALQARSAKQYDSSLTELLALMALPQAPESMNKACLDAIDAIATAKAPELKKQQTTRIIICAAAIVAAIAIAVLGIMAVGGLDNIGNDTEFTGTTGTNTTTGENTDTDAEEIPANSAPALDANTVYYADIDIADYGKITVKLDQASAPATSANFVNLANQGFYDGLTFHRIMEDFMMQGGCPYGNGTGGSEENVVGEFAANGYNNPLSHTRGAIAMARATPYNSASSQFFICHKDVTSLDGQYAVFGYVTEGIEVVDAVCTKAEPTDNNGTILPSQQPVITSITIRTEPAA